ncbi:MAG TPA: hypothetical protein VJP88_04515 [Caulobacteraceae bacterium]|nr:hypothetical protein [Caulobacteraceae bacterium]
MPDIEERGLNIAVAVDELGNAIIGGKPRETISGTVGRAAEAGDWIAEHIEEPAINALMGNPEHCQEQAAIEEARRVAEANIKS